ncbi:Similar to MRPL21: 39S ribosomal protein L21 [Cotesia congregata]|uniref:Large ribosomal subunit protein bL21m n=1 Tax=Cotesia congregata TaxID=51543 RepID=A0A8J2MBJ5_COTCN|nr:Similar to MRPL21: 39S ribosomal protein L21 [Cotesia congregata]
MALFIRLPRVFNVINNCLNKQLPINNTCIVRHVGGYRGLFNNLPKKPVRKLSLPWIYKDRSQPMEIPEPTQQEEQMEKSVIEEINNQVLSKNTSRLFAIIVLAGKQFKVTENDLIVIQGYWPPNPGDKLRLEKVLLVGGMDFTLVGRPLLNRELVGVDATVVDKTFSHTKYEFRYLPRKQFKRLHMMRSQLTTLRINSIDIKGAVDEKKEVEGLDRVY